MLNKADLIAFVPTRDPEKARAFYRDVLGLQFISEDPFALVFNANDVMIRIANVSTVADFKPASFTILGWHVTNAEAAIGELEAKGVTFERFPWMEQSEKGIWTSPSGAKIAWFKDPDGNVLSITET